MREGRFFKFSRCIITWSQAVSIFIIMCIKINVALIPAYINIRKSKDTLVLAHYFMEKHIIKLLSFNYPIVT